MTRYAMAIDVTRCVGCKTCSVACKMGNNLPATIWRNRVETIGGAYADTASGTYPNDLHREFHPISCQHCTNPPCLTVCPVEAIAQRDDGIVTTDEEICIGCGMCVTACPYEARSLYPAEPEYYLDFPLGDFDAPTHTAGKAQKCDFCLHRLERGAEPACMEYCCGAARYWGDMDDPESEISLFLAGKDYSKLKEEEGTDPNCYYIL